VEVTNLLMYDLRKNYTWDSNACNCSMIEYTSEMPIFSLPPIAIFSQTNVTIIVNGNAVLTDLYSVTYSMDFSSPYSNPQFDQVNQLFSFIFEVYVDKQSNVARALFNYNAFFITVNVTTDFWNIQPLQDNNLILPDTLCKNVCQVNFTTVTTYPPCTTPTTQCVCPNNLTFCTEVDYPVTELFFLNETDIFADVTYTQVLNVMTQIGEVSQECKAGLKDFLCKFYFPLCSASGSRQKPDLTLFTCGSTNTSGVLGDTSSQQKNAAIQSNGAFSAYMTQQGMTKQYPNNNNNNNILLQPWQIALIVIAVCVFLAAIVVTIFLVMRKRRSGYKKI